MSERIQCSTTDPTTLQMTVRTGGVLVDDGTEVRLQIGLISYDQTTTSVSGEVQFVVPALTGQSNYDLIDATIRVASNQPIIATIEAQEEGAVWVGGIDISDDGVTYYTGTATGGGGPPALVPVKRLASEDDVQYLFANNPGYVEGSTSAYMIEDAGGKFASPAVETVNRNGDGMQAQLMSWANIAVRGGDDVSPGAPPLTATREITFTDMNGDWGTFDRLNQVSVWGDGAGLGIDTIESPFLDDLAGEFTRSFFHYSYVLRDQNATQATATINSITASGVDGGTY